MKYFNNSSIEIVSGRIPVKAPEHVFFDFDGTISLIRNGWQDIMSAMIVEILQSTGTDESKDELESFAASLIEETTGIQTIYQMIRLAEEVNKRGGNSADPLDYKHKYNARLLSHISKRRESLKYGEIEAEAYLVPCAREMLEAFKERGVTCHLGSGTDVEYVKEEAALLGVDEYFGEHIHGALDDYRSFSKKMLIERVIAENSLSGETFAGFGDGFVDIETVKSVGGTAVAVASDESGESGTVDKWKRRRLIKAGADAVIPDFRDTEALLHYLSLKSSR